VSGLLDGHTLAKVGDGSEESRIRSKRAPSQFP